MKRMRWVTLPALMLWKRVLSYRKREWELADYPVQVRMQEIDPKLPARLTQHRYWAHVHGWSVDGGGATRAEALADLKKRFDERKAKMSAAGELLPRPGIEVPPKFAPQERIAQHKELVDELLLKVLSVEGAWVSDESSLWNFHCEETNEQFIARIRELYGVDVSDIKSGNLAEIVERIAASKVANE